MENLHESVTETRVRLYRKALDQLREENALKEAESAAKKAESGSEKEPNGPSSERADTTAHEDSDKA